MQTNYCTVLYCGAPWIVYFFIYCTSVTSIYLYMEVKTHKSIDFYFVARFWRSVMSMRRISYLHSWPLSRSVGCCILFFIRKDRTQTSSHRKARLCKLQDWRTNKSSTTDTRETSWWSSPRRDNYHFRSALVPRTAPQIVKKCLLGPFTWILNTVQPKAQQQRATYYWNNFVLGILNTYN